MYRMLITFHILFFTSRISTDVSMEVDTDNENISFVECKIYGRNMVDDKGKNFEQNTSDKTTIWMHSSGNQTEWILLLGCYNLRTLSELNFTDNKIPIDLRTSSKLQECITSCHEFDNKRRYFGLQDNNCFCYENNDVTVNSDCVPHNCVGSESLCGTTNESVVLYHRGEFVKNHQERFCGELEENIKTSNNDEKICQYDLSYLCTDNIESTNSSCHKQVMWFADRRNSTNRCVSTSNGIPITPTLPKDNSSMHQIGQFTCEIFDLMNLTSIEIASSCINAAYFIQNFTTEGNNWNTSHLLQCSKPDNLICTTPSTGLYNDKNTNCSFQNCIMYIIIGLAVIVMLVVLVSAVCICRKKTKAAKRELAPEEIQLNTIRKSDSMEQPNAEVVEITNNMYSTAQPNIENIETSDNLYSTAKPFQQTTVICDNVSSLEHPSTADIEISNNVHRILQPITGTTEISGNVDTTVHPDTGTIYTTDNNENQYNILDHTLLNTRVDNGNGNENAVYDQIKPSVIPTDKFAGSVYDSVALVHKMSDKPKK